MPAALVCVTELGLGVGGYGYHPGVTVPCRVHDQPHYGDNLEFGRRFFPAPLAREFEPFVFPADKPAGTYRIFVLGASAAQGVPNHAYRFGRILEVMLQERFPDIHLEVITAAMAAINSHVVLEITRDCARFDPDLFVVYLGNNEVVGPYGPGTVLTPAMSNLHLIRAGIAMRKTRIGQLLSEMLRAKGLADDSPEYWHGMEMFLGQQVRMDDPRLETVYSHYRRNLEDICRVAAGSGAKTVLCTVGANLVDSPPFASLHRPNLTDEERQNWERAYRTGTQHESRDACSDAIASYLEAAEIDDSYADLQFRLGRCHWQQDEYGLARERFVKARDLDVLRFRADTRINEVVRTVAGQNRSTGVHLVDVVKALQAHSARGVPGEEFFHEHVHLTFHGNYCVAEAVYRLVESLLRDRYGDDEAAGPAPTERRCAQRLVYSEWSRRQSLDTIVNQFLAKPPFTNQLYHEQRVALLKERLDALKARLTAEALADIAERYGVAIGQAPEDWRLHWDYGKLLAEDLKQYDAAASQYRLVQSLLPHSYTGYDALGSVLRGKGDLRGAVSEYEKVLAMKPSAGGPHYYLGWCYQEQGKTEQAVGHYRKAIRLSPYVIPAYINLGELLFKRGELEEAARVCRAGLAVAPNHPLLHCNLGMLLIQMGQRQEGTREILTAQQLDPNSAAVRRIAERLLGPHAIH